ncbi:PDR/VanB family oxidoreductase [Tomitella gaofuii]|uniref:PDR/VanB family oxidoreductase n=1 Tax=Tomitella gaofuii TaxID=2760083 RepID=UPI0015FBAD7E|nr:PDR/VanB family oxidoreductase [Tomitella gaofuii]
MHTTTTIARGPGPAAIGPEGLQLTVTRKSRVATDVVALDLRNADGAPLPAWRPGAHIEVRLPTPSGELVRHYSLCGDPADRSSWRIAVLREQAGRGGSAYIHDLLDRGETLAVTGPRNNFPLEPSGKYLFIAGGIGITPILPMVREAASRGADWRLVACTRTADRLAFAAELRRLPAGRASVHVDEDAGVLDLDRLLAGCDAGTAVYVCGPPGLIDAVDTRSATRPWRFFAEQFVADAVDTSADVAFEVEIASTGDTYIVPADSSILHTLNDAGFDLPSSCEEGTCGTCETGVLDGVPDHRDVVLSKSEKAENDCMMLCVSRAACSRLVLDL